MKLQAPDNCSGASFNGVTVDLDDSGVADVINNPELVATLIEHGFAPVDETMPKAKKPWQKKAAE